MRHAACRQVPFHGKGRQVIKDSCKNIYKQSCETGIHENMKACWRVGVWCMKCVRCVSLQKAFLPRYTFLNYACTPIIYLVQLRKYCFMPSKPSPVLLAIVPQCQACKLDPTVHAVWLVTNNDKRYALHMYS